MDTTAHLAAIDRLRARPFPSQRVAPPGGGTPVLVESGPGFHIADLRISEDFWDADVTRIDEVAEEFEAELQVLVAVLAQRWGEPAVVCLLDHLERAAMGEPVAPPWDVLCGYVPEVYAWRVDGRWVGLGLGQGGRELPFRLVLAIAEAAFLGGPG